MAKEQEKITVIADCSVTSSQGVERFDPSTRRGIVALELPRPATIKFLGFVRID
jgi:hypothetical protein